MTSYSQKKIAVISDMAGWGKCALTISLPVISATGIACCPVPTSVFSNHTGYPEFYYKDLTSALPDYVEQWKRLHFSFQGILSGYLASEQQIDMVTGFIQTFKTKDTLAVIDPVMGDHGKTYRAYTPAMCKKMKALIPYADILTPNLTEACILTDTPYREMFSAKDLTELARNLSEKGPEKIVITGISQKTYVANFCYEKGKSPSFIRTKKAGSERHGTGDLFASLLTAYCVNGEELTVAVRKTAGFIKDCLNHTIELGVMEPEGLIFEDLLYRLRK